MAKIQHYRQIGSNPAPNALLYGELAVAKDGGLFVGNEAGVPVGVAGQKLFDQVIRTQAEFEALIASPTWLNAVSVCFVGNGGTLKFTRSDGKGVKIPQTVKQMQGMNSAIIEVSNFAFDTNTNRAALWYATLPTTTDYWINGMTVHCISLGITYGFTNCAQLSNCTCAVVSGNQPAYGLGNCTQLSNCVCSVTVKAPKYGYGFVNCAQLNNCTCTVTGSGPVGAGNGYGFTGCKQLNNCTGVCSGVNCGYSFETCTHLNNCIGTVMAPVYAMVFLNCTQLSNCAGTGTGTAGSGSGFNGCVQLSNCSGTGTGKSGHGFVNCSYLNGCKQGETASTTAFLGGTNSKVDTSTIMAS